ASAGAAEPNTRSIEDSRFRVRVLPGIAFCYNGRTGRPAPGDPRPGLPGGTLMGDPHELLEKVERLKLILVQRATGELGDTTDYAKLRRELLGEATLKGKLPGFLKYCTTLGEFWAHIKEKFGRYQERRDFLRDEFLPVITMLEGGSATPSDSAISAALAKV